MTTDDLDSPADSPGSNKATTRSDAFPATMNTWIGRKLDEGPEGLAELNRHVMEVYREPLMIYFKGSSYRWMGDAEDFVQGFFADRLHKQNYLAKWRESDLQLRRYLSVGFLFYLKESQRAFLRENRASALPAEDQLVSDTGDPQVHFDRACAQALVAETIRKAEELCLEKQLGEHWRVFLLHWRDGVSYRDLAPNFGVTPQQAGGMASTGRRYFIRILREVIADQLADSRKVDQELRSLLEASES